jgi:hypothetical protein
MEGGVTCHWVQYIPKQPQECTWLLVSCGLPVYSLHIIALAGEPQIVTSVAA